MARLTTRGQATNRAIVNRETFTTSGALCAETGSEAWRTGELPGNWAAEFWRERHEAQDAGRGDEFYVVYSYATPIAWYNPIMDRWSEPLVKYSRTTTKHQGNLYGLGNRRSTLPALASA